MHWFSGLCHRVYETLRLRNFGIWGKGPSGLLLSQHVTLFAQVNPDLHEEYMARDLITKLNHVECGNWADT